MQPRPSSLPSTLAPAPAPTPTDRAPAPAAPRDRVSAARPGGSPTVSSATSGLAEETRSGLAEEPTSGLAEQDRPVRGPARGRERGAASRGRRMTQLLVGLVLYGIAMAAMMRAAIGIEPWDVLAQGITVRTGIPFGLVTNIVGGLVLLFWIPLRQRPGLGTVLNVLLVGPSAQFGLWAIPQPAELWARILLFAGGLVLIAIASGLYIGAQHGPGPRDGLMTGLHARTGRPIWLVRTAIEATVLLIGWLLGGDVGWGTLAVVAFIGPLVHVTIPLFALRVNAPARTALPAAASAAASTGASTARTAADLDSGAAASDHERLVESDAASRARTARDGGGWPFARR